MLKINTIINYCTNDYMFIRPCIEAVAGVSNQVIVPVCNTMYDGVSENRSLLDRTYFENPNVLFPEFPYLPNKAHLGARFWTNMARFVGLEHMDKDVDYIFFLDADEIVDTTKFVKFLESGTLNEWDAIVPVNYWYFRDACFQSLKYEASSLIIRANNIDPNSIFTETERVGIFESASGRKNNWVLGLDKLPFVHHYSWVRSKEQMLRKVQSWGHKDDKHRQWEELVEEEFSHGFTGTDFIHGYEYKTVEPICRFDLPDVADIVEKSFKNVVDVDKACIDKGIELYFRNLAYKKKLKLKCKEYFMHL